MEQEARTFRNRVTVFTFFLTLLVVWVHALNLPRVPHAVLFFGNLNQVIVTSAVFAPSKTVTALSALESLFANGIGQIAVPGFFFFSGYLFFRTMRDGMRPADFLQKWKRRVRSLLVPYFAWNLIWYALYIVIKKEPLTWEYFWKALLLQRYNLVFWYMRQLIVLVALAPLIGLCVRRRTYAWSVLLLTYLAAVYYQYLPVHPVNEDALFYYTAGAVLALHAPKLMEKSGERAQLFWGILLTAAGCICGRRVLYGTFFGLWEIVALRLLLPLGLYLLCAAGGLGRRAPRPYMRINVLIYAAHLLEVKAVNEALLFLIVRLEIESITAAHISFAVFLSLPLFCVAASCLGALILWKWMPRLYGILTGGR